MTWSNVHLIFCEGPHDSALVKKLIANPLGLECSNFKASEMPYPLAQIFKQSFETQAAGDFRLDLAKKFFLPDYFLHNGESLVLVFNYGGSNRKRHVEPFLDKIFTLLSSATTFSLEPAPQYTYVFFADADAHGRDAAIQKLFNDLREIGEEEWLTNEWTSLEGTRGKKQKTITGDCFAYIWADWNVDIGTSENIIHSCIEGQGIIQQTINFLDEKFNWAPNDANNPEQICSINAKKFKAAFCIEGQRKKPGSSLSVIIDQAELIGHEDIARSPSAQDCIMFLTEIVH